MLPDQLPFEFDLDEDEPRDVYTGPMRFVTSVSQIKMFSPSAKGCPRKWALHYLSKFPRERTPALVDGIRLHRAIKDKYHGIPGAEWHQKWKPGTPTADLALALMRRVPDPPRWISEPTYFLEVPETAIFIKPDLLAKDWSGFKDWKSTSAKHKRSPWTLQDPAWWPLGQMPDAASGDKYFSLKNDLQARIYAHGLMTLSGRDSIQAEWMYGSKKFKAAEQPQTWSVSHTFFREETRDWVEMYALPVIRTMNALRAGWAEKQIDSGLLVPHNAFACDHKGRFCDLLGQCNFWKSPISLDRLQLPVIPS